MPTKTWVVGEEVLAADFNSFVQRQVVATFPNAAARNAAIPSPTAGMLTYCSDTGKLEVRTASTWVALPGTSLYWGTAILTSVSGSVGNTPLVIPGLTVSVTLPVARWLKLSVNLTLESTQNTLLRPSVWMDSTTVIEGYQTLTQAGWAHMHVSSPVNVPAGTHSFSVYLSSDLGTAKVSASPAHPASLLVEDLG